jgi:hypothetical protein
VPASDGILFRNGTVFDGRRFLPPGTCVRVQGGRITAVEPAGPPGYITTVRSQMAAARSKVIVLHKGKVVERGPTPRVLDDPQDPYTRQLRASVPRPGWKPVRRRQVQDGEASNP